MNSCVNEHIKSVRPSIPVNCTNFFIANFFPVVGIICKSLRINSKRNSTDGPLVEQVPFDLTTLLGVSFVDRNFDDSQRQQKTDQTRKYGRGLDLFFNRSFRFGYGQGAKNFEPLAIWRYAQKTCYRFYYNFVFIFRMLEMLFGQNFFLSIDSEDNQIFCSQNDTYGKLFTYIYGETSFYVVHHIHLQITDQFSAIAESFCIECNAPITTQFLW